MSQAAVAQALSERGLKLDPTAITRMEKGDRGVRLNEAKAIAQALGIDLGTLLLDDQAPPIDELALATEKVEQGKQILADLARQISEKSSELAELERQRARVAKYADDAMREVGRLRAAREATKPEGTPEEQDG